MQQKSTISSPDFQVLVDEELSNWQSSYKDIIVSQKIRLLELIYDFSYPGSDESLAKYFGQINSSEDKELFRGINFTESQLYLKLDELFRDEENQLNMQFGFQLKKAIQGKIKELKRLAENINNASAPSARVNTDDLTGREILEFILGSKEYKELVASYRNVDLYLRSLKPYIISLASLMGVCYQLIERLDPQPQYEDRGLIVKFVKAAWASMIPPIEAEEDLNKLKQYLELVPMQDETEGKGQNYIDHLGKFNLPLWGQFGGLVMSIRRRIDSLQEKQQKIKLEALVKLREALAKQYEEIEKSVDDTIARKIAIELSIKTIQKNINSLKELINISEGTYIFGKAKDQKQFNQYLLSKGEKERTENLLSSKDRKEYNTLRLNACENSLASLNEELVRNFNNIVYSSWQEQYKELLESYCYRQVSYDFQATGCTCSVPKGSIDKNILVINDEEKIEEIYKALEAEKNANTLSNKV